MKTLHEVIQYHSREAELAKTNSKRIQHRTMQTILEAHQIDLKLSRAKKWLKQ